ncbi:MAG: hypothetical protein HPY71_15250 [Firmicutes bacterium]|nr:hypothetical protein [Bacillota bacterium]
MDSSELLMALEMLKKLEQERVDTGQLLVTLGLFDLLATMSMLSARLAKARASAAAAKSGATGAEQLSTRRAPQPQLLEMPRARAAGYEPEDARRVKELPLDAGGREGRSVEGDGVDEGAGALEGTLEKKERPAGIGGIAGEGDGGKKLARKSLDWRRQWKQSAG